MIALNHEVYLISLQIYIKTILNNFIRKTDTKNINVNIIEKLLFNTEMDQNIL